MDAPLDPLKTSPRVLGPDVCGGTAVLLLHGFTGTPWEVLPLAESLAERGYAVRVPRLPGHGTTPEAMAFVTWRDWEAHALAELDALAGAEQVVVGGLSMGGLLAMRLALKRPRRVAGLVLLAPAVKLKGADVNALRLLRHRRPASSTAAG